MDRRLIAPAPDMTWKVSSLLVPHRERSEAELVELNGRELLMPDDESYYPDKEALEWRVSNLRA